MGRRGKLGDGKLGGPSFLAGGTPPPGQAPARAQLGLAPAPPRAPWEPAPAPAPGRDDGAAAAAAAGRNPVEVYLQGLAPASRRHMRGSLAAVAELLGGAGAAPERFPWATVRFESAKAAREALAAKYAPATANRHLAALRGVLRTCLRLKQISAADYQHAIAVRPVQGERLPAGREVTPGELRALFAHRQEGAVGARDAALLGLLYGCGLRRAEACALQLADYDAVAGDLRVQGKGRRERIVYPGAGAREALADWLALRGTAPGPLLTVVRKGGAIEQRGLSAQAVYYRVQALAARAGLSTSCSPHDLRRAFVADLLDQGADVIAVRDLAGHADVNTTLRYDRRGERGKRAAAGRLVEVFISGLKG